MDADGSAHDAHALLTDPLMTVSEPGRWWTSANTAEAMQGVLTPLDFSFQSRGIELGGRRSWKDFGVLTHRDVYEPTDANDSFMGAFYGRIGINVNVAATLMDRLPGASGADIEMALLGFAREDVAYPGTDLKRLPFVLVGGRAVRQTQGKRLELAEISFRKWWASALGSIETRQKDALTALLEASERFDEAMHLHLRTRFLLIMAQSRLARILAKVEMMEMLQPLTSAVGTAEAHVAEDLWAVAKGKLQLEEFVERHGYHGPNEGAISSPSWREDARPVRLSVSALAEQPESESPAARRARMAAKRSALEQQLANAASKPRRATKLVAFAQQVTAWTEQGKLLTLLALDVGRCAARVYGEDLVKAGTVDSPDDVYYFTISEIRAGLPPNARELAAYRRAKRDEYRAYDLPLTWTGDPAPLRLDTISTELAEDRTVRGVGCNGGLYEGRARIVFDPATDALEAGDVLVCSATDPSWLGLFVVAGAVVADIGGPTSHGAIVAREFGLPCVMGATNATRFIRDGDSVRVDGTAGTVEVLHVL